MTIKTRFVAYKRLLNNCIFGGRRNNENLQINLRKNIEKSIWKFRKKHNKKVSAYYEVQLWRKEKQFRRIWISQKRNAKTKKFKYCARFGLPLEPPSLPLLSMFTFFFRNKSQSNNHLWKPQDNLPLTTWPMPKKSTTKI